MCLMLDTMGERYGMLPSEVFSKANTFDVHIYDTAASYRAHVNNKENDHNNIGQDYLKGMVDRVRKN